MENTVFCKIANKFNKKVPDKKNHIDIYVLAGQSNAAGFTPLVGLYKTYTYGGILNQKKIDEYTKGYPNVLYYGITQSNNLKTYGNQMSFIKAGKGADSNKIGPELGFAEKMSAYYGGNNGKIAIIKYAVGSTGFTNPLVAGNITGTYGNWMSPSIIKELKDNNQHLIEKAGLMYQNLLLTIRQGISSIIALGYNPVIKGVMWLQGCEDACNKINANLYCHHISALINDLRNDLYKIMDEYFINYYDLQIPFIICKIGKDLKKADYYNIVRENMQITASKIEKVRIVETDDFVLPDINDNNDVWHFSAKAILKIGNRFADIILQETGKIKKKKYIVTFDSNGGTEIKKQNVIQYMSINEPPNPTKEKYIFEGWYEENIQNEWSFTANSVKTDITLKALWKYQG